MFRVTRRIVHISLLSALSLAVGATPGYARPPVSQATDPSANSPAGVVYEIPLDSARQDAAPHKLISGTGSGTGSGGGSGGGGSAGGGGAGGAGGPPGGVSSGVTPTNAEAGSSRGSTGAGTNATSRTSSGAGSRRTPPVLVPGGEPGSLVHSANGFGSSSEIPGVNAPLPSGLAAVQGNASSAPLLAMLLSLFVLAVGGYVGVRSWRSHGKLPSSHP